MLYDEYQLAEELAAQLKKTDLGVTDAYTHTTPTYYTGLGSTRRSVPEKQGVVFRLDNGQEFYAEITRWGGPRA